jgi:Sel1 repeat
MENVGMQFAQSLHKAADIGDTDAQTALGWMYFKGEGVRQDYAQALKLVRKAADRGNARAQAALGMMYLRGQGRSCLADRRSEHAFHSPTSGPADGHYATAVIDVLRSAPLKLVNGGDCDDSETGRLGAICFTDDDQPVDPTRRSVRRIFNNSSWYDGGRLFDGFWETMKRADRFKFLRIRTKSNPEGERIANVDFGQLFPTLAYHRIKRTAPDGDLYDIVGDGTSREGWKKLINALLFADGPMIRWPEETSSLFAKVTKLRDAIALVPQVHAPIAKLFGTGIGFKLMLTESEILIRALGHFAHKGITALPLHDSVLVAKSDATVAEEIMAEAFGMFANDARAKLKVTFS